MKKCIKINILLNLCILMLAFALNLPKSTQTLCYDSFVVATTRCHVEQLHTMDE